MEAKGWDDNSVFGKAYPKNTKPDQERKNHILSIDVFLIVAKNICESSNKKLGKKEALGAACNELGIEDERTALRLYELAKSELKLDPEVDNYDWMTKRFVDHKKLEYEGIRQFQIAGVDAYIIR